MTKVDIVEAIYEKVGFSKKEVAKIVETIFDLIKENLEKEDKIKISGSVILSSERRERGEAVTLRQGMISKSPREGF